MKIQSIVIIISLPFLLISCASNQPSLILNEAESQYESARMIKGIFNTDAQKMGEAKEALGKAKQLQENNKETYLVDHYATISIKNTEIAEERHRLKQIELEIEEANKKRQQLLLQARSQEAKSAKMEAMKLAAELDALQAEQTERGIILTLENIVFAFNSAVLESGGDRTVARIAQYLNDYPQRHILIEGFTDNIGSEAYNLELSRQRAEAVEQSLIRHGVDSRRIGTVGLGEAYPIASNGTNVGRQKNRRVEIVIANQDGRNIFRR